MQRIDHLRGFDVWRTKDRNVPVGIKGAAYAGGQPRDPRTGGSERRNTAHQSLGSRTNKHLDAQYANIRPGHSKRLAFQIPSSTNGIRYLLVTTWLSIFNRPPADISRVDTEFTWYGPESEDRSAAFSAPPLLKTPVRWRIVKPLRYCILYAHATLERKT